MRHYSKLHRAWAALWSLLPDRLLPVRLGLAQLARIVFGPPPRRRYDPFDRRSYAAWLRRNAQLSAADRAIIRGHIAALPSSPVISIAMPVRDVPLCGVLSTVKTVRGQLWPHWELCVALAPDASPETAARLAQEAGQDGRIRVVTAAGGSVPVLLNAALDDARGGLAGVMLPGGELAEEALYEVTRAVLSDAGVAVIYADEDQIDSDGHRYRAWLKPDFDAELLLGQNLLGSFTVYDRALLRDLGGMRGETAGAALHDLALRATARVGPDRVRHIPAILYHGREDMQPDPTSLCSVVAAALRETGTCARVEPAHLAPNWARVVRPLPDPEPLVSVIVPTRDRAALLSACAEGVLSKTAYRAIEFIIVDNGSEEPETLALFDRLRADTRVRILREPGRFNYSALNNRAARQARGDILVLLNNDIEVMNPDWLREMVSQAVRPEVGAVGAKLYYADGSLQHGGVVLGAGGVADHYLLGTTPDDPGYFGTLALVRQVSAVTGACLALRHSVYDEVGGLDEANLPVAFNDVDLCLRIRQAGYRVIWTPFAELYHLESASRGRDISPENARRFAGEVAYMQRQWGRLLKHDPFYSPWFSLDDAQGALAQEPRCRASSRQRWSAGQGGDGVGCNRSSSPRCSHSERARSVGAELSRTSVV